MITANSASALGTIEQLNDRIYTVLLQRIIDRKLKPGDRVIVDDLAQEMGTSITPIRESLYRLQEEGLLTRMPYKGWTVRIFSRDQVVEIYQVRAALESFATELCCSHADATVIQRFNDCQERGEEALASGNLDTYRAYNDDFHQMLLNIAGNQTLANMMQTIRNQVRLFSMQTIQFPGRPQKAIKEHRAIIGLIEKRNAVEANQAMRNHVLSALEDVLQRAGGETTDGDSLS